MKYPIKYNGETFEAESLTIGKKQAFCNWLLQHQLETFARLPPYLYQRNAAILAAKPPEWSTDFTPDVRVALSTAAGARQYYRLLLAIPVERMSDKAFDEMIASKEAEGPTGDLNLALKAISESHNPKATPGPDSSPSPAAV